jgi:NTP pyrophosphatase (non-canonical NTP hydrolase)
LLGQRFERRIKRMDASNYQGLAMRTNDHRASERLDEKIKIGGAVDIGGVLNASLGLSGESGEVNDMIKKWIFHEKELDLVHLEKEIGDVCWYIAMMCEAFGFDLGEIMRINIDKLIARYPEGFDPERANNRPIGDV